MMGGVYEGGWSAGTKETLNEKLSKAIGAFGAQLGSSKMGTLTQVNRDKLLLLAGTCL